MLTYANSLQNDFSFDDSILVQNYSVHGINLKNLKDVFTSVPNGIEYLPVRDLTYMIDYELWGLNPFGFHLSNLLFYLVVCWLLYLFLYRLLRRLSDMPIFIAFLSTLLFAVHPLHVESVASISQRKDLVSGLLFFCSLISFLKYKENRKIYLYIASILLFCLSFLAKGTVVSLPIIILLLEFYCFREDKSGFKLRVFTIIPFFVVAFLLSLVHYTILNQALVIKPQLYEGFFLRLGGTLKAIIYYLKLLIIPYPLRIKHPFSLSEGFFKTEVLFSLLVVLILLYLIYRWQREKALLSFSIAWYLVNLIPVVGLIPTSTIIAERYLFLPSVGLCLALSYILLKINHKTYLFLVFCVIIVLFSVISINRNKDWLNDESLFGKELMLAPDSYELNQHMGKIYFFKGEYEEAFRYLKQAKKIDPKGVELDFFLAYYSIKKGRYNDASLLLNDIILRTKLNILDVHYLNGIIEAVMGDREKAMQSFQKALVSDRSISVFTKKDVEDAINLLEKDME